MDDLGLDFIKKGLGGNSRENEIKRKEMEVQHETELHNLTMSLKKIEKELGYKDEEIRHYKNMASQVAE